MARLARAEVIWRLDHGWGNPLLRCSVSIPHHASLSKHCFIFSWRLFIHLSLLWLHWFFVAARELSLLAASRGYFLVQVHGPPHCSGSSYWGTQVLGCAGSAAVVHGLSCPTACGILVPQPGIEPVSFALAGRFLTTAPAVVLLTWQLTSLRVNVWGRKADATMLCMIQETTRHHFCHILWITETLLWPALMQHRRGLHRVWVPGGEGDWGSSWRLAVTFLITILWFFISFLQPCARCGRVWVLQCKQQ